MTPPPRAWTAVLNPAAGRGRGRTRLPRVAQALADSGLDVEVVVSADAADLVTVAGDAFRRGRAVAAGGGDGTVCALAGLAAERDGVLGILPFGSGNDFARHLDIPSDDLPAAIATLRDGDVVRVDLGRAIAADGHEAWFTTVANTGFDAEANRWANEVDRVSGTPLYVLAALRTLATYQPHRFLVGIDGEIVDTEAWLVAVGNTRTYASGMMITPGADVHDGLLDVCVVGPVGRADFLRTFPRVFSGTHVEHPMVRMWRAAEVTLEAPGATEPLELWASGERVGPLPARIVPAPAAVQVVVPASGTTTRR